MSAIQVSFCRLKVCEELQDAGYQELVREVPTMGKGDNGRQGRESQGLLEGGSAELGVRLDVVLVRRTAGCRLATVRSRSMIALGGGRDIHHRTMRPCVVWSSHSARETVITVVIQRPGK
jgi:hypothetical protein